MKVTKYPHSCFKIELESTAVLIDAGNFSSANADIDCFGSFDALLITHEHPDHAYDAVMQKINDLDIPIYANKAVQTTYPAIAFESFVYEENIKIGSFSIRPLTMTHSKLPDGSDGPENTAFLFNNSLIHCGDSNVPADIQVGVALIAIAGPDISMKSAADLAKSLRAQKVIPMHYDNPVFYNDPHSFKERLADYFETIVLEPNESIEV